MNCVHGLENPADELTHKPHSFFGTCVIIKIFSEAQGYVRYDLFDS